MRSNEFHGKASIRYNGTERICSRLGDRSTYIYTGRNARLDSREEELEYQFQRGMQELISDWMEVHTPHISSISRLQSTGSANDIYYYSTNHLGSTAFVTDNNATVTQGFLYAPFGEITTEYNASFGNGIIPKYTFNAKELDEETGMYYYEARYYAPPVFTSRDPMFEKYFWMSPYAYCANNPVKYVDPSGREIVVSFKESGSSAMTKVYYKSGRLYTDRKYTSEYTGNNDFARSVESDLNNISLQGGKLNTRLNKLVDSKNTHIIRMAGEKENNSCLLPSEASKGMRTGSEVIYKRDNNDVGHSRSSLVHELLGHSYNADQGKFNGTRVGPTYQDQIEAINIQNVYNKSIGIPLRVKDGKNRDIDVSKYLDLDAVNN